MNNIVALAIGLAVAVAVLVPLVAGTGPTIGRVTARRLMSEREVGFWRLLVAAAEPFHVAPQVAMGALLDVAGADGRGSWRATRNRFDRKIVDFVLIDDDGGVRLLIELDDRMHRPARDAARDAMTAQAGYRTLRVNGVTARDWHLLKAAIDDALGVTPSWTPPGFNPAAAPRRGRSRSARPNIPRA